MSDPNVSERNEVKLFVPFADHIDGDAGWRGIVTLPAGIAGGVAVLAAFARVIVGGQSIGSLAAALALGGLIVALVVVYSRLRKRNAGLFVENQLIGEVDALGQRHGTKVANIDHLHLCSVIGLGTSAPTPLLLFVNRDGRVTQRFYRPDALEAGGLQRLASQTGLLIRGSWDEQYTAPELQKRFPNALPAIQTISVAILAHPHRTTWIASGITIGLFVVLMIVLLVRSSH